MDRPTASPVLILGAGVNGACVARELAINGVPVCLVDRFDIAYGATAKSSRLIHGGLRYLEYGDVSLVRESLDERARLLRLAPQYVRPLRLYIPVRRRFGGMISAGLRFARLSRTAVGASAAKLLAGEGGRGLTTVRMGLWLYDRLTGEDGLPPHDVVRVSEAGPRVDGSRYEWLCSYSDAQMPSPERFTLALLEDARKAASERGVEFRVLTHHLARLDGDAVRIEPTGDAPSTGASSSSLTFKPASIVNATGAWGDLTLQGMNVTSRRLFGGTKGSHLLTRHRGLIEALRGEAVYAEADDGRLVFILPLDDAVLIGTTDERFDDAPETARATASEIEYLLAMVNEVFPQAGLSAADVASHYSGVRPLPFVPAGTTGAIPRGHWIESTAAHGFSIETLIGGKLTTCRALGEEVADRILERLDILRGHSTRERPVPGAEGLSQDLADRRNFWADAARLTGFDIETAEAAGRLLGSRAVEQLSRLEGDRRQLVGGTPYPTGFVEKIIASEWVANLEDLVERRLMLVDRAAVSRRTLTELAAFFTNEPEAINQAVDACESRLRTYYGIVTDSPHRT